MFKKNEFAFGTESKLPTNQEEARKFLQNLKDEGYFEPYIQELKKPQKGRGLDGYVEDAFCDYLQFLIIIWITENQKTWYEKFIERWFGLKKTVCPTWYGQVFWARHYNDKTRWEEFCLNFFGRTIDLVDRKADPNVYVSGREFSVRVNNERCKVLPFSENYAHSVRYAE